MGRLLILALLVGVVAWWLFSRVARLRGDATGPGKRAAEQGTPARPTDIVPCAHCGVHLPRAEAIADDGDFFCGEVHRRLGRRP